MARPRPAPREQHPAEVRRAEVLANPAGFTASIRFGNRNNTLRFATLLEAGIGAIALEKAVASLGGTSRAIVYALPQDGGGPETVDTTQWRPLVEVHLAQKAAAARGYSVTPNPKA